jgi:hypothetical protein
MSATSDHAATHTGGDDKDAQADAYDAQASEPIRESARRQQHGGKHQEGSVDDPLQPGHGRREVSSDRRKGDRRRRPVESDKSRCQDQSNELPVLHH